MKSFAVAALLIPLFFINIRDTHIWGDDFAQYIQQGLNIAEGKSQSHNAYIFNPDFLGYAPPLLTPGFPIILAPVCYFFGNDLRAFNYLQTVILFFFGLTIFYFFRKFMDFLPSLLLMLVVVYNPEMLYAKAKIMADLPFSLLMLLSVMAYLRFKEKPNWKLAVLTGCVAGFTWLIKPVGVILIPAFVADFLINYFRTDGFSFTHLAKHALLVVVSLIIFFTVNFIMIPSTGILGYFYNVFNFKQLLATVNANGIHYINLVQNLFSYTNPNLDFMAKALSAVILALFLLGFIRKIISRFNFVEIVTLLFIAVLLLFPYDGGHRYLFPIFPILMLYVYHGYTSINMSRWNKKWVFVMVGVFCLFQYKTSIENLIMIEHLPQTGPNEQASREAFDFITNNTPEDAVIAFIKPRALALYTHRKTLLNNSSLDYQTTKRFFEKNRTGYYLLNSDEINPGLNFFLEKESDLIEIIWENEKFTLYRKIDLI